MSIRVYLMTSLSRPRFFSISILSDGVRLKPCPVTWKSGMVWAKNSRPTRCQTGMTRRPQTAGAEEDITVSLRRPRPLTHRGQDDGGPHALTQDIEAVRMRRADEAGGGAHIAGHAVDARPEAPIGAAKPKPR